MTTGRLFGINMKNLPARATAIVCAIIACFVLANSAQAEKIRTAIPSASIHYLSLYVAEEKGFFKEEKLENEVIAIGGPAGIAALGCGGLQFKRPGGGGTPGGAARGAV